MAEKVDQDVREAAADYADEHIRMLGLGDDIIAGKKDDTGLVQAFARMKEAGRQQGLREAAEVARGKAESVRKKARLDQKTTDGRGGLVLGYEDAATAITALMEGEGK